MKRKIQKGNKRDWYHKYIWNVSNNPVVEKKCPILAKNIGKREKVSAKFGHFLDSTELEPTSEITDDKQDEEKKIIENLSKEMTIEMQEWLWENRKRIREEGRKEGRKVDKRVGRRVNSKEVKEI